MDKRTKKSRRYAFICLDKDSSYNVLKSKPHFILNKQIECKFANETNINSNVKNNKKYEIFVGGLPLKCKEKDLRDYFSKFGSPIDVIIKRNAGQSRGYGFLVFENSKSVETITKAKHKILNSWIECKIAYSSLFENSDNPKTDNSVKNNFLLPPKKSYLLPKLNKDTFQKFLYEENGKLT